MLVDETTSGFRLRGGLYDSLVESESFASTLPIPELVHLQIRKVLHISTSEFVPSLDNILSSKSPRSCFTMQFT